MNGNRMSLVLLAAVLGLGCGDDGGGRAGSGAAGGGGGAQGGAGMPAGSGGMAGTAGSGGRAGGGAGGGGAGMAGGGGAGASGGAGQGGAGASGGAAGSGGVAGAGGAGAGGGGAAGSGGSGVNPEAGIVHCAGATCDLSTDVCCISLSGQQCRPQGECAGGLVAPQACDGPEDCAAGQRCCVGFPQGAACAPSCGSGQQDLCHADADCDGGRTCQACSFPGAPPTNVCTTGC